MTNYHKAQFLLSVAESSQLPKDQGAEVAFIGRSNAGKSSVINQLTHNKGLARVSKTPGRTQFINLFTLDDSRRLADLPGYGFARVPKAVRERWQANMDAYLQSRACLKGLILVMDIRHPLQAFDEDILYGGSQSELPVHILLNKVDKLNKNQIRQTLLMVQKATAIYGSLVSFQIFSALTGEGIKELKLKLNQWLG